MIRTATTDDMAECLYWAERFHREWHLRDVVPFDEESMFESLYALIDGGLGVVFLSGNGFLVGMSYPMPLNKSFTAAQELYWFCNGKDEGLRDAFEAWAAERGARIIDMCFNEDERAEGMKRLYRMKGYRPMETHVVKEIH